MNYTINCLIQNWSELYMATTKISLGQREYYPCSRRNHTYYTNNGCSCLLKKYMNQMKGLHTQSEYKWNSLLGISVQQHLVCFGETCETRRCYLLWGDLLLNLGILNWDVNNLGVSSTSIILSCFLLDHRTPWLQKKNARKLSQGISQQKTKQRHQF